MSKTFGEFLQAKRFVQKMTLREAAKILDISAMYLSELENNKKSNPNDDIIFKLIKLFALSKEETIELFELHAIANSTICLDLPDYIMSDVAIRHALRTAKDKPATSEDWQNFIEVVKNKADK